MTTSERIELTKYLDFTNPDAIRVKGHRIGIEHILDYYLDGYNPDKIAQEFPGLSLKTIYAAITHYLTNRAKMDAYLLQRRTRNEQAYQEWAATPSPLIQRLRAVREKRAEYITLDLAWGRGLGSQAPLRRRKGASQAPAFD